MEVAHLCCMARALHVHGRFCHPTLSRENRGSSRRKLSVPHLASCLRPSILAAPHVHARTPVRHRQHSGGGGPMNNLQSWKNGSGYYSANAVGGPHAEGSPIGQAEPSTERDGSLNGRGHLQGCSLTEYTSSVARQRRALSTHADHQQDKFCLTPCISRPPYPGGCFCRAQVRTVFEGATGCTSSAVAAARAAGSEASC